MIVIPCLPCNLVVRVMAATMMPSAIRELRELVGESSDLWPNKFKCPRCGATCTGVAEAVVDSRVLHEMELRDLTPVEAFAAFMGAGFPEERQCSLATLQELLKEHPVRKVIGTEVKGMARAVIDSIELWDGTVLHFGASPLGAIVYRIVCPPGLARAVKDVPQEAPCEP